MAFTGSCLASEAEEPRWHVTQPEAAPDFVTLIASEGWQAVFADRQKRTLERDVLPDFMMRQRWFGKKDSPFVLFELEHLTTLQGAHGSHPLTLCEASTPGGDTQSYFLPLCAKWGSEHLRPGAPTLASTLAKLRAGARVGGLIDAANDVGFIRDFIAELNKGSAIDIGDGKLLFCVSPSWEAVEGEPDVRFIGAEQTNVSMVVDERIMLKIYRRVRPGLQPELELAQFLTDVAHYQNTPKFLGAVEHVAKSGVHTALAIAFAFVPNQGDAWNAVVDALDRAFEDLALVPEADETPESVLQRLGEFPLNIAKRLGERTAELHLALATPTTDSAFAAEDLSAGDIERWCATVTGEAERVLSQLERMGPTLPDATAEQVAKLLAEGSALCQAHRRRSQRQRRRASRPGFTATITWVRC